MMTNHWIKTRSEKSRLNVGDWVYWKRELFTDVEWATILLQFGVDPMCIVKYYFDTTFREIRLEVIDSNGHIIMGVRSDRLMKVDKNFEAKI